MHKLHPMRTASLELVRSRWAASTHPSRELTSLWRGQVRSNMDYAMVTGQGHDSSPSPDVSDLVGGILAAEVEGQRDQLLLKVPSLPSRSVQKPGH